MTLELPTAALKRILAMLRRDVAAMDASCAPQLRPGFGKAASMISRMRRSALPAAAWRLFSCAEAIYERVTKRDGFMRTRDVMNVAGSRMNIE
jgi:hypothetical protein